MTPAEIAHSACVRWHALQRYEELAQAVALVAEIRPRVVVEIGCDAGGTLYCWRQLCDRVYGITLLDNSRATGGQFYPLRHHGATIYRGDSHDSVTLQWLRDRLGGDPVDVLHIDGDHSYAGVQADWEMYAPLVRDGGLVLIHDVLNTYDRDVEVPRFWADLTGGTAQVITSPRPCPLGFGVIVKGVTNVGTAG